MTSKAELIEVLEKSHALMIAHLQEVDKQREIYPVWTIREMLAHLTGWDVAAIDFLKSIMAGQEPATPAADGINAYNAKTIASRQGLDYDSIHREYLAARRELLVLLHALPEAQLGVEYTLPWAETGSVIDIVNIYGPHEVEHAEDVEKILQQYK